MIAKVKDIFAVGTIRGNVARIYSLQFLTLGISLVGGIIVARVLGPADKGMFDLFNLINSFIVELGLLGFGSGLLYYLANKGTPLDEVHGTGLVFSLGIGVLTALAGWLGLPLWKKSFPGLSGWIILLAFSLAPVTYYRLVWTNIMTGINKAVATYKVGLVFAVVNLMAVFVLLAFGYLKVQQYIVLTALIAVLYGASAFVLLYRRAPALKPRLPLTRDSLKYGLVIYAGIIANVLHFKIDQVMINYWLGTKEVGIYAVSVNWAEMLFVLDSAITSAALYKISSSSAHESYALTRRLFKAQFIISGGTGMILCTMSYPLVVLLYGREYVGAVLPLVLLVPGIIAWSVSKILAGFLTYNRNLTAYVAKVAVWGAVLNAVLNYIFLAHAGLGIAGASLASSISYLLVAILVGVESSRVGGASHAF